MTRAAPTEANKVCALYAEGHSIQTIGRQLGKSHEWARQVLLGAGVVMRPRAAPRLIHAGSPLSRWTAGDDQVLILASAAQNGLEATAASLGRTENACDTRCDVLDIARLPRLRKVEIERGQRLDTPDVIHSDDGAHVAAVRGSGWFVKLPFSRKAPLIANPDGGFLHTRGAA